MSTGRTPVAVTGLGIVCSIGADVPSFTEALRTGVSGIVARPGDAGPPPFASELPGFDFPGALADLPAEPAERAHRMAGRAPLPVRVATVAALQAWRDARLGGAAPCAERIGLVVAGTNLTSGHAEELRPSFERDPRFVSPRFALRMWDSDHVGVLSHVLGIRGEGHTVGAASASGTVAIAVAARLVAGDTIDACLVVGALAEPTAMETSALLNLGAMASGAQDGRPGQAFDAAHRGFVPGQGCACIVLESTASAAARGVPTLAVLCGHAVVLDGNSLADPARAGEARAMATALAMAGVEPADLSYVNAHGTGSVVGDRTELAALRDVLGRSRGRPWLNATKALTGHCLGAAGVVEAVASVLQLRHGFVHPNPDLREPIEDGWRFAGPVVHRERLRSALSNSFGFGGFNASIVLREAT